MLKCFQMLECIFVYIWFSNEQIFNYSTFYGFFITSIIYQRKRRVTIPTLILFSLCEDISCTYSYSFG